MRTRTTAMLTLVGALVAAIVGGVPVVAGPSGGALPPVLIEALDVVELAGVPDDSVMVAANVTAVEPADGGFVTVWPCDQPRPDTSNVNYVTDQIVPNLVLSRIDDDGFICVYTHAVADIVIDIVGHVPADSALTPLPAPARLIDTRTTDPDPIPAGDTIEVQISGTVNVPSADVAMFNLTAIAADQPGFLTAYPCDEPRPTTSNVNYDAGGIVPNLVTSRLSTDGTVCIYTHAPADLIIDVAAYADTGIDTLDTPVRIVDTRNNGPVLPPDHTFEVDITAITGVPDHATAAIYNLTSTESTAPGYATSHPCDEPRPNASNLNHTTGQNVANGTITKLSTNGHLCIYHQSPTHLIIDLIGYTTDNTHYTPLTPTRIWDTRQDWRSTCNWLVVDERTGDNLGQIRLFDAADGTTRTIDFEQAGNPSLLGPVVDDQCTSVLYFGAGGTHRVSLDGDVTFTPMPDPLRTGVRSALYRTQGSAAVEFSGGRLLDTATGLEVWDGPDLGGGAGASSVAKMRVSPSGVAIVELELDGDAGYVIETWDMRNDRRLFGTELTERAVDFTVSPNGRYFTVQFSDSIVVASVFGDPVDSLGIPPGVRHWFTGTGEVLVCAQSGGTFLWQLFGPVDQQLTWPEVSSAIGWSFCALSQDRSTAM